jgi:hypothetical protein
MLLIVLSYLMHHHLYHTKTMQLTKKRTSYLNRRQYNILLTKHDLCVYYLRMAKYFSGNMME